MDIRQYTESDYNTLVELINEFNEYIKSVDTEKNVKSFDSPEDLKKYADQCLKDSAERNGFLFVAEENGEIVGFVQGIIDNNDKDPLYGLTHISFSDGWIGELYVRKSSRGKGYGKQLVQAASDYLKNNGCKYVRLLVMSDNKDSIEIYKSLGFQVRDLELSLQL